MRRFRALIDLATSSCRRPFVAGTLLTTGGFPEKLRNQPAGLLSFGDIQAGHSITISRLIRGPYGVNVAVLTAVYNRIRSLALFRCCFVAVAPVGPGSAAVEVKTLPATGSGQGFDANASRKTEHGNQNDRNSVFHTHSSIGYWEQIKPSH